VKKRSFSKSDYVNTQKYIGELKNNADVRRMKNYIQHGRITTFKHCERVAAMSYYLNRRFRLHADNRIMLTAAMLHDFYLYDWHDDDNGEHNWHGYIHANTALKNAKRLLNISLPEQRIIYSHMWPLNITRVPKTREAWIVCLADKYISAKETLFERKNGRKAGILSKVRNSVKK